ncbi:CU044_2847 family protein [Streptomyces sp. NBC_00828]|uniref:CU044_2847 family protein n=1 Tax=Streptomyces sp. NBC_00828 TaxID=2903678 RepID=UPI00386457DF
MQVGSVADFVSVTLADGTQVLFQTAESDLVEPRGARVRVESADGAGSRLETIAAAVEQVCAELRTRMSPDEVQLEIGVGLSGEVGWFFAKSAMDGSLKVTLTWRRQEES